MMPYLTQVKPGQRLEYRLLLRNNLGKKATYQARLIVPIGWQASDQFAEVSIQAEESAELKLIATAPPVSDGIRRLMTAEICIEGTSQGPVVESLVTVHD